VFDMFRSTFKQLITRLRAMYTEPGLRPSRSAAGSDWLVFREDWLPENWAASGDSIQRDKRV